MVALTAIHGGIWYIDYWCPSLQHAPTLNLYENRADLYGRKLDIATEVTVVFHLIGNHFQINLVLKSFMINNVFKIKCADRSTLHYAA